MASVTQRIKTISQPKGGYLPVKSFKKTVRTSEHQLHEIEEENISPTVVGMAVDYLTRIERTESADKTEVFNIALRGAQAMRQTRIARTLLDTISGLDDDSITAACRLSCFDAVVRGGYTDIKLGEINPNSATIENIREMVTRSISYLTEYGPVTLDGFTMPGGYTETTDTGDGDYLLKDTLVDFKVSKNSITNKHTLQLLMYWRMGMHSTVAEFRTINKLAVYNPRLDTIWSIETKDIPEDIIEEVERDVIGYGAESPLRNSTSRTTNSKPTAQAGTYSVSDLCTKLGVSKNYIYNLVKIGYLPDRRKGKAYYFTDSDLMNLADRLEADIEEEKRQREIRAKEQKKKAIVSVVAALIIAAMIYAVIYIGIFR